MYLSNAFSNFLQIKLHTESEIGFKLFLILIKKNKYKYDIKAIEAFTAWQLNWNSLQWSEWDIKLQQNQHRLSRFAWCVYRYNKLTTEQLVVFTFNEHTTKVLDSTNWTFEHISWLQFNWIYLTFSHRKFNTSTMIGNRFFY